MAEPIELRPFFVAGRFFVAWTASEVTDDDYTPGEEHETSEDVEHRPADCAEIICRLSSVISLKWTG
jgi:hypothetical protein